MTKEFCKKHIVFFTIIMAVAVLLSNLILGVLQEKLATNLVTYYIVEAVFKFVIIALLPVLIKKWGFVRKAKGKTVLLGLLFGALNLLFIIDNLLPLTLVNPIHFKIYGSVIGAVCLAKISVGIMEELGIRGILLPLLCEKWAGKKGSYRKAAFVSSLLFAVVHFSWTVRELLFSQGQLFSVFSENVSQVIFAFCFGMLAAGVTLYVGSLIPMFVWHSLVSISAFIERGLMPNTTYIYYMESNLLTIQKVFEKYNILSGVENGYIFCRIVVNILVLIVGIMLVKRAEERDL